jgi:hypothetical protein
MVIAAALAANSIYLALITFLEWTAGRPLRNYFYQYMFLTYLTLGLLVVVPFAVFVIVHVLAARHRRSRQALRTGYALGGPASRCSSPASSSCASAGSKSAIRARARLPTGCTSAGL